jgi:anti-sigma regulatory factor (Ser/Thr protein kinase)
VTNSVRHGGLEARDAVNLQITSDGAHVRVSVHDGGQGFDLAALEGDGGPLEVGGQGLVIVAALSDTWGVERSDDGCTVWCELALEEESVAAAEREITTGYVRELAFELARSNGAVSA